MHVRVEEGYPGGQVAEVSLGEVLHQGHGLAAGQPLPHERHEPPEQLPHLPGHLLVAAQQRAVAQPLHRTSHLLTDGKLANLHLQLHEMIYLNHIKKRENNNYQNII